MDLIGILGDAVIHFGTTAIDVAAGGIGWVVGTLADLIIILSAALPNGDLMQLPQVAGQWEQGLGWLNWWLPIGQLAALMTTWVASTIVYFVFQLKLKKIVFGGKS